jgi:hypothetical protein
MLSAKENERERRGLHFGLQKRCRSGERAVVVYSSYDKKVLKGLHFLAVVAVIGEPLSVWVFPVLWENTGKFWRIRPLRPPYASKLKALRPNSLKIGTGNLAD